MHRLKERKVAFKERPEAGVLSDIVTGAQKHCPGISIGTDDALIAIHGEHNAGTDARSTNTGNDPFGAISCAKSTLFDRPRGSLNDGADNKL
jgi:hypothetical protein